VTAIMKIIIISNNSVFTDGTKDVISRKVPRLIQITSIYKPKGASRYLNVHTS
jgi:hypothetical protein